jgi:hypothetical protein
VRTYRPVTAALLVVALAVSGCHGPAAKPAAQASRGSGPAGTPSPVPPGVTPPPSPSPTPPAPAPPGAGLRGCPALPATSVWHADVSRLPASTSSAAYVASIGTTGRVKADFGSGTWNGGPIGIPITYVPGGQARVPVSFDYAGESDKGPYPMPRDALVEGGPAATGDRHVLVVDTGDCRLYELYAAHPAADGSWHAGSGAVFDLRGNRLRPAGWTSADAAGLPVAAGLVRYEEVAAGRIDHAIRVTVPRTRNAYVWPARHAASRSTDPALPPMGLRLRLKASVDMGRLPAQARVIAQAMKVYGVIVADNGSAWYLSGAPDSHWDNDALRSLGNLQGSDFEAVDESGLMVDRNSDISRN